MKDAADATADLDGLVAVPCDPLILAVRIDGRPLDGLTGRIDWRVAGVLSDLVRAGAVPEDRPLLYPAPAILPVSRLVLWRAGAVTPADLARLARAMDVASPGLCPHDFRLDVREVRAAFGGQVVVYA